MQSVIIRLLAPRDRQTTVQDHPTGARWREMLSTASTAISSALTHAPENAAYGLMALAPLGVAFGATAMGLALLGAAVASATASVIGAGRLVGDAGAALALLTTGIVAALLPHVPGPHGDAAWQVLILVALGIAAGGVLTALFGLLRIGGLVKFTPYPVRVGLSTGVGLLLIASASPAVLGHPFSSGWTAGQPILAGATLIGLCALGVTTFASRARTKVPPVLLGLAAATLLQAAAAHGGWGSSLSRTVGVPELPHAWFGGATAPGAWLAALTKPAVLTLLGGYALTISVVASLDTLLAASIVDGRLRGSRDANRELVAQGFANLASAVVGGLPASPAVPASVGLVMRKPAQRHIALAYSGALLGVLLVAPNVLGVLPVSAVGGVLLFLGLSMISPTLWQTPMHLWSLHTGSEQVAKPGQHRWREPAANWAVTVVVALITLLFGLGHAVLIGASIAVLLFVLSNMRDVVRRVWSGEARHSLKTRPSDVAEILRRDGHRIVLLELEGSLFFGTADALRARLHGLCAQVDTAILDLHQISDVDLTAARILYEISDDWARMGKPLVFAEWPAHDPRRGLMESVANAEKSASLRFEENTDLALEHAEEQLLERLQIERNAAECLRLGDTMIARGLSAGELALLAGEMTTHEFPRGQVIFRAGDPGDALYISLKGEIGLRIPGTTRRLASFAPGVTIGEMAVLAHAARSAEAVAESDVTALGMSVESFERLMRSHPALAAKLSTNIALHLAHRVRMLTTDLAGWVSRSGAGRPLPGARLKPATVSGLEATDTND
jgi:SulP family sulfate permease